MSTGLSILSEQVVQKQKVKKSYGDLWPEQYINKDTQKVYTPHNEDEEFFVYSNEPRRMLLRGGEGAGKSVAGIIKTLNRLRDGMSGLMGSPTLPHFTRSLWQEFCRWCPSNVVIERHRHRLKPDWKPNGSFQMVFYNKYGGYSTLECGGFIENQMGYWEGPTVSFVYADEIRQHKEPIVLKTLEGRIRMPGPMQEPPQIYFTTTPRKHWLYEYFGPVHKNDKFADFKEDMFSGVIPVELNRDNLSEGYIEKRKQSLTESEVRVLMNAEWEDTSDVLQYIHPAWWNPGCHRSDIPQYNKEPVVVAIDASKGRESSKPDNAALVAVSRHPTEYDIVIPRYVKIWDFDAGQEFNFSLLTEEIAKIENIFSIIEVAYDSYQLAHWAQQMRQLHPGNYKEFGQEKDRLLADGALQARIMSQQIYHDGNPVLTEHLKNANCKKYANDNEDNRYRIRIVKRHNSGKVDAAVALSMATWRIARYNVV